MTDRPTSAAAAHAADPAAVQPAVQTAAPTARRTAGSTTAPSADARAATRGPRRLLLVASGRGSNARALWAAAAREAWPAAFVGLLCDQPQAPVVAWAQEIGLPVTLCPRVGFESRSAHDAALARAVQGFAPDAIVLAGYLRILADDLVNAYAGRMLNIHPSLLPAFPGLHTHRQALAAGVARHGCSVHWVTPTLDAGPLIAQAQVPVQPGDTEETLGARVLEAEHQLYPWAVARWLGVRATALPQRPELSIDAIAHWRWVAPGQPLVPAAAPI